MGKNDRKYFSTMKDALMSFDLKTFNYWAKKYNKPLWDSFSKCSKTVQMATMCKCIFNRTDMLNTEAYKKAVKWLSEHNMKGEIY